MTLGGSGIGLSLRGQTTNAVTLPAGATWTLPGGSYAVTLGAYTALQFLDPISGRWMTKTAGVPQVEFVQSDGANWRLANLTGCPVGAVITTASATGATTGIGATATNMTVTPSSGSSTWVPIVGGAISTTVVTGATGATAGAGYLYPPTVLISPPPAGGLQATAHATITGGTVLAAQVVIDNQGAGYNLLANGYANATVTFINDPRDTKGAGATVRLNCTGTGLLTGLYPTNHGTVPAGTPTLAFSVGAAGATVLMCNCVTSFTGLMTGATWATGTTPIITSIQNISSQTPVWTNPLHEKGITFPRPARIQSGALNSNQVTPTGAVYEDNGYGIQGTPALIVNGQPLAITGFTGAAPLVAVVGGVTDTSWVQPV